MQQLRVLKIGPHGEAIGNKRLFLGLFHRIGASGGAEKRGSGHDKGVILCRREFLVHQAFVFEAFVQFPAPPGNLSAIDFVVVDFFYVFGPLFLFRVQFPVPVDLVYVAAWVSRVKLVAPPANKNGFLCPGAFGCYPHVVEHVEASGGTFKHVVAQGVLFGKGGKEGSQSFLVTPRRSLSTVQKRNSFSAPKATFRSDTCNLIEQA